MRIARRRRRRRARRNHAGTRGLSDGSTTPGRRAASASVTCRGRRARLLGRDADRDDVRVRRAAADRRAARTQTGIRAAACTTAALCAQKGGQSSDRFGEHRRFGQQADDQERPAAQVEEVAGVNQDARLRSPAPAAHASSLRIGRHPQDRRPAGLRRQQRARGRTLPARARGPSRLAATRAAIAARMPAPSANSSGSACWTGAATDR